MLHSDSDAVRLEIMDTISDKDFSEPFTRDVFLLAQSLYIQGLRPTLVLIYTEGMKLGFIQTQEDREKAKFVSEHYTEDQNIGYWLNKVKNASKGRSMQRLLNVYANRLSNEQTDITELIREASGEMISLAMNVEKERVLTGKDIAEYGEQRIKSRVEAYRKAQEDAKFPGEAIIPLEGVPTGFPTINSMSLGYKPGDLIVLGAQTGHGKTAFAIATSKAVCIEAGESLYYLNTEMSKPQLVDRWAPILAGEPMQQIRTGSLTNEQMKRVLEGFRPLSEAKFYTDDKPLTRLTPQRAEIKIRKYHMQFGIKLAIIDYVGRMQKLQKGLEEWQVLEQIVKSMKELAQELGIAIMVLAQLNPDGSLQGAKRIKNECDMMFTLEPISQEDDESKKKKRLRKPVNGTIQREANYYLHIEKARDFASNRDIPLFFDTARQQIREVNELKNDTPLPPLNPSPEQKEEPISDWGALGREIEYPD